MNRNIFLIVIASCILITPLSENRLAANTHPTPIPNSHITLFSTPIPLETPLIRYQNQVYFPIRDCLKPLNASLAFQKKDNRYFINIQKTQDQCYLLPYSREFWLNNTQNYFQTPPILYERRLYLPLNAFFSFLDYRISNNNQTYTINKIVSSSKRTRQTPKNTILIKSTGENPTIKTEYIKLPEFEHDHPMFLSFGNQIFDLTNQFFYDKNKNILLVDMTPLLKQKPYNLKKKENKLILTKGDTQIILELNSYTVTFKTNQKETHRTLEHPVIQKNNKIYFPIKSLLSLLDLSLEWNPKQRILTILNKIHKIQLIKQKNTYKILIYASYPIEETDIESEPQKNGYYIDLPYTKIDMRTTTITGLPDPFHMIQCEPISKETSRLSIKLSKPLSPPHSKSERNRRQDSFSNNPYSHQRKKIRQQNDRHHRCNRPL